MVFQENSSLLIKCAHALEGQYIQLGDTKTHWPPSNYVLS